MYINPIKGHYDTFAYKLYIKDESANYTVHLIVISHNLQPFFFLIYLSN